MISNAQRSFASLLVSEAKGFFFLKFMLTEHTSEDTLNTILCKAHRLYDAAVAASGLPSFVPHFVFVTEGELIKLRIQRAETSDSEVVVVSEVPLVSQRHASGLYDILALKE